MFQNISTKVESISGSAMHIGEVVPYCRDFDNLETSQANFCEWLGSLIVSPEVLFFCLVHLGKLQILFAHVCEFLHLPLSRLRRNIPSKRGKRGSMCSRIPGGW